MPSFKQKNVIKSYKLRLQEKLKTVTEETQNVTSYLNNCVSEFGDRVQHILETKDEKCLSLYRKLSRDLENYSEKIFIFQASLEASEEDSDSPEEEFAVSEAAKEKSVASAHQTTENENCSSDSQNAEGNFSLPHLTRQTEYHSHLKKHPDIQQHSTENVNFSLPLLLQQTEHQSHLKKHPNAKECSVENEESLDYTQRNSHEQTLPKQLFDLPTYSKENINLYDNPEINLNQNYSDDGSVTEDDFYSLHSDNVQSINIETLQPEGIQGYEDEIIHVNKTASNVSVSQSSCYNSISSNLSESLAFHKEKANTRPSETSIQNQCSLTLPSSNFVINPPDFAISSTFSGNLSFIIDPSDFWIQLENSQDTTVRFPKSKYADLKSLPSIAKGHYCLAPFRSTPFYYRAQSLSDAESASEFIQVLFIDHGSIQGISVKDLRPLPSYAFDIPAQALNCYLHGIAPSTDSWSDKAVERLKDFQNFCIETTIISRENLYGVQLVAKLSDDNFSEDFSVDIASALCLDGFAISLTESPVYDSSKNKPSDNQASDTACKKVDLSIDDLDLCEVNAISSDSGVSFTSSHKSDQIPNRRNETFNQVSKDYVPVVAVKNSSLHDDKFNNSAHVTDLISFDSNNALSDIHNSYNALSSNGESPDYCHKCRNKDFCFHLEVPSPTLLFVEQNMVIVMLSHIVNPQELYVNMAMENIVSLDDLREQMTCLYESGKVNLDFKIRDLTENMFCAARFAEDNYWYRVKILNFMNMDYSNSKKNEVLVQFIDYGNTSVVKCCDLKPLTPEFSKHPVFAIKCALAGISPAECQSPGENIWNEDAIKTLKMLVPFERCLTAQICSKLQENHNDTYSILLWDTDDSKKDVLINALLAEHQVAVFDQTTLQLLQPSKQSTVEPEIDSWDPMLEEFVDSQNSYDVDDEDIEIVTTGYHAKDEEYTCKYFSLRGYCPRGSNCPYQHLPLLESGVTRDQEEVYCLDTMPAMLEEVNNVLVTVSAIVTPSQFYVILPFGCRSVDEIDDLVYKGASYREITNLEARTLFHDMNKHYSNTPFKENTSIALSCGTIVVAKRKWDEKWHRGRVIDVIDIDKPAKIFFVDSGDFEWVPRKFIRTILPQFLYTHFQAIQCSLHGVIPASSDSWSSEAIKYFKEIVTEEILLAEVKNRLGGSLMVSLRKTTEKDHQLIQQKMVFAGFANFHHEVPKKSNVKKVIYVPG